MADSPSLADRFYSNLPSPAWLARQEPLEDRLQELLGAAAAAWPEFVVPTDELVLFLAPRLPAEDSDLKLEQLHVTELYLVCGCLRGDGPALAAFERQYLSQVDRALAPLKLGA